MLVILIFAALVLAGCVAEFEIEDPPPERVCTEEARACPDGSFVARNPDLNCDFNPCPAVRADTCEGLAKDFDAKIDSIDAAECDRWAEEGNPPIWVGGTLLDISKTSTPDRNEFTLTFQGLARQDTIIIGTAEEDMPYQIGTFYKFDLGRECMLLYSMASSGMFSDPSLDALQPVDC